jgi:hypothetical protein
MSAFRHYVDIVAPGTQADAANQIVGSPQVKLRSVPCSIETVTGGEVRRGQQMQANVNRLVTMRFLESKHAPTTADYLDWQGDRINILAAYDPDGRRREILVQGRSNG